MNPRSAETSTKSTPPSSSLWVWVAVAFGVWVFLQIAVLTIPKYGRRKAAIDQRAEGRSRVWQEQLKQQGAVARAPSRGFGDLLLIGAVSVGGALVVGALAVAALRRRPAPHPQDGASTAETRDSGPLLRTGRAQGERGPPREQP